MADQSRRSDLPLRAVAGEPSTESQERTVLAPPGAYPPGDHDGTSFRKYVELIVDSRWIIAGTMLALLAVGFAHWMFAEPVYESDVVVQVEEKPGAPAGPREELPGVFDVKTPTDTEIEVLRARTLIGAVVDELHLDLRARPRWLPFVGRGVARWHVAPGLAAAPPGLERFAWGGERVRVERFDVPPELMGKSFKLVARGERRFDLVDPAGKVLISGEVGAPASVATGTGAAAPGIMVSEMFARPGTEFIVQRLPRDAVVEQLRRRLAIAERGRKTGVIRVGLKGSDPQVVSATLDAIARAYLRHIVSRKSAEAEKTLEFIAGQLPQVRANLDAAEQAVNSYRGRKGSIDVSLETRSTLDRLVAVEREYTTIEMQAAEAKQRFTENHPVMTATLQKLARLKAERDEIDSRLKRLPREELESARLMRDLKVADELYVLLLNKSRELQVVKSGTVGNVFVLDPAIVPAEPTSPRPLTSLGFSLVVGVGLGFAIALVRKSFHDGVEDPDLIEHELGLPVYAAVPHSETEARRTRRGRRKHAPGALAAAAPHDLAVEAMRSLRTSVQFALAEAANGIVAIAGPSPATGKTFVLVNLAQVLADAGSRVLVIDGDLRKGTVHEYFDEDDAPGLSDLVRGTVKDADAVRKSSFENLDVVTRGKAAPNPSELLASKRYRDVVERLAAGYDVVLIDTAPVLAVADSVLAGRVAGMGLLVVRSGRHPMREIAAALKQMSQGGMDPRAIVLNDVMPKSGGGSRYRYTYHYEYK
jgi:tyrosine-protein kinase Etk/Wzc